MMADLDINAVLKAAHEAVERDAVPLSACWSSTQRNGHVYRGGVFGHGGSRWVAVRGVQNPGRAQLLDATACFKAHEEAEFAVALLDEPATALHRTYVPSRGYRVRARAAAWRGLGILWTTTTETPDAAEWQEILAYTRYAGLGDIGDRIERAIRAAASPTWVAAKRSPDAEKFVRPVVDRVLRAAGYEPTPVGFATFWRYAETDGAWHSAEQVPARVVLEVKVDEDADAPFCQLIDDLGAFDVAVQVRLLLHESVRRQLYEGGRLHDARDAFVHRLPVKLLTVRFCALCRNPMPFAGESYPYLVCDACDARAVNAAGSAPTTNSVNDDGENPVWIGGQKCWRRYRFGGWVTMHDPDDCSTEAGFLKRHKNI